MYIYPRHIGNSFFKCDKSYILRYERVYRFRFTENRMTIYCVSIKKIECTTNLKKRHATLVSKKTYIM